MKELHYISYEQMGAYLMEARKQRHFNRCEFVRKLNECGHYRWDQSAYRKCEIGQMHLTLDRMCEICAVLGIEPSEVIRNCTKCV